MPPSSDAAESSWSAPACYVSPLLVFPLLVGLARQRSSLPSPPPSPLRLTGSPAHRALGGHASVYTYQFGKSDDDVSISCLESQFQDSIYVKGYILNNFRRFREGVCGGGGGIFQFQVVETDIGRRTQKPSPGAAQPVWELYFSSVSFVCLPRSPFPTRRAQHTPERAVFSPFASERGY